MLIRFSNSRPPLSTSAQKLLGLPTAEEGTLSSECVPEPSIHIFRSGVLSWNEEVTAEDMRRVVEKIDDMVQKITGGRLIDGHFFAHHLENRKYSCGVRFVLSGWKGEHSQFMAWRANEKKEAS